MARTPREESITCCSTGLLAGCCALFHFLQFAGFCGRKVQFEKGFVFRKIHLKIGHRIDTDFQLIRDAPQHVTPGGAIRLACWISSACEKTSLTVPVPRLRP